jgi:aryl-alcohol dehydrogenase-like predicted oxidoreductase
MERRPLGKSGLEVSRIGLGVMPMSWGYFGDSPDDPVRVIARAFELGVTHLDTADVYGPFTNEELLGRALAEGGFRDEVVVATKVGLEVGPNGGYPLVHDARPERILREAEGSLRRLGVEAIDLYYLHRVDGKVPFEEQWGALASLVQAGKVRAIGLSEVGIERLEVARGIHPVAALQSELSLWTREAQQDIVPWCAINEEAFVPFSSRTRVPDGTVTKADYEELDFRKLNPASPRRRSTGTERSSRSSGVPPHVWGDARPGGPGLGARSRQHVLPIPGTKRIAYLEENVAALDLRLTPTDRAELRALPPCRTALLRRASRGLRGPKAHRPSARGPLPTRPEVPSVVTGPQLGGTP